MSAGTSALFSLMVCFLVCSSDAQEKIPAKLGKNATLPCKVPNNNIKNINNVAVEWIRPDQDPEYVLVYRNGLLDPHNQHPSYQNRVDLKDKDMKDGDVSLILKNVTMEDRGTYECRVFEFGKNDPISTTFVEVYLSGDNDEIIGPERDTDGGNKTGIIVGSVVGVIVLALLGSAGFWLYKRLMKKNPNVSPDEEAAGQMLAVPKSPAEPPTATETLMNAAAEQPPEM